MSNINAQEIRVIDNKGTITKVRNNQVTTSGTTPTTPLEGDVWLDTNTNISKIYDGTQWLVIDLDNVTKNTTAPTTPVIGDIWFDTSTTPNNVKVWDSTAWLSFGADFWGLKGNANTNPTTDFIGTTDANDLILKANNVEKIRLNSTKGQVLINQATSFKNHPLVVRANGGDILAFQDSTGVPKWHWNFWGNNGLNFVESNIADYRLFLENGGNVGIGTGDPNAKLHINSDVDVDLNNEPPLRIGTSTGLHIDIDGNEIGSYNNGTYSKLYINASCSTSNTIINLDGGSVGIGADFPTRKLDINGDLRIRDIQKVTTPNLDILVSSATGVVQKKTILTNKSYVQTYKTTKNFTSENATLLHRFPTITIQPNKKVKLELYVPTRAESETWGGLYVNVNANVNGTWYNLGNTGYDGGAMSFRARTIHALNHEMLLDFVGNLGLSTTTSYTLQFELTARSYDATTVVNGSHGINATSRNLGSRGSLQTWASDQNYTHIIITEMDR